MSFTIGACGFSATGSSAVVDYLKEFDENVVKDDFEFTLAYRADGLQDLRFHLNEGAMRLYGCRVALKRFIKLYKGYTCREYRRDTNGKFVDLSSKYLEELIQVSWVSTPSPVINPFKCYCVRVFRKLKLFRFIFEVEKYLGHEVQIFPLEKMLVSINPSDFDKKTRNYVMAILDAMGRDSQKNIVLDQPFCGNNPQAAFPYFENPKAIVVDRDPRDYYCFIKKFLYPKGRRQLPCRNVEDFVTFYRKERENMPYMLEDSRILRIQFEDLIYRYDETTQRICDFCGLDHSKRVRKIFDPELSKNNTQVFKRYPELLEDVKYIEDHLKEFLFSFEDYKNIDTSGPMFMGKSPLNK